MVREAYENWERLEETNGNGILYNNVLQSTCTKLGLNYSLVAIVLECSWLLVSDILGLVIDQTIQESEIAPSPLHPGSDIQFVDSGEDEGLKLLLRQFGVTICGENIG